MKNFALLVCLLFIFQGAAFSQGHWSLIPAEDLTQRVSHTATVVDGKIYLIGGQDENGLLPFIDVFDPATGLWTTLNPPGFTPRLHLAACLFNGKIYVFGGAAFDSLRNRYRRSDILEVYDPGTNTWETPATMGTWAPRVGMEAEVINGKVYLIGGIDDFTYPKEIVMFDPVTNTWSYPETLGTFTPRTSLTTCVIDNKIYAMGGMTVYPGTIGVVNLNTVEVFDPSTTTWTTPATTGTFTARHGLASSILGDKIYVVGGWTDTSALSTLEIFDPNTNLWSKTTTTGAFTPRSSLTASVVDNKIYAIGGTLNVGAFNGLAVVEVFNPGTSNVAAPNATDISVTPNPTAGMVTITNVPLSTESITITNVLGDSPTELIVRKIILH